MTWFAIGAAVVAGVAAAATAVAQKHAADYNQAVDKQKMTVAAQQGAANEDAMRRRGDIALGREAAAMADAGTGLDGSNADVYKQSATAAELDALNVRYQAKLGVVAANDQLGLDEMAGDNAVRSGVLNVAASSLSSYGNYARFTRSSGGLS